MRLTKATVVCALILTGSAAAAAAPARRMSRAVLEDKVRGGWAGQMIGVAFGAPTEFRSNGKINEGELKWTPDMIGNTIHQDDLYVEMTFAEVMDRIGLEATTEQYGEMFRDSRYSLWHANAGARRNLNRGIKAPMSGHPDYNVHANDIDFQIESDFIGLMCPGLPQASNHFADRVGRVMNYGDGLYGGMLFGAMYASAFFETDPHRVVEAGPRGHPGRERLRTARPRRARVARPGPDATGGRPGSGSRRSGTGTTSAPTGRSFRSTSTPASTGPTSCSASSTATGTSGRRWRSRPGPGRTPTATPRARPASSASCSATSASRRSWKAGIPGLADTRFEFTRYSFNEIVTSTLARAEKVIVAAGGTVGPRPRS